jgi:hypothetical protein
MDNGETHDYFGAYWQNVKVIRYENCKFHMSMTDHPVIGSHVKTWHCTAH